MRTTSGRFARHHVHGLAAVAGLADDLDVVGGLEQHREAGPHQGLVVGYYDPDHGAGSSS